MSFKKAVEALWAKHKRAIILLVLLYFVLLALITVLASGPQSEPFIYQGR